jgi:hypothetical protein
MSFAISEQKNRPGLLAASVLFLLLSACGGGGGSGGNGAPATGYEYQPPANIGDSWTIGAAGDHGMSVQRLEDMMDAIGRGEFPIIKPGLRRNHQDATG